MRVVLPEPKKPVTIVTGVFLLLIKYAHTPSDENKNHMQPAANQGKIACTFDGNLLPKQDRDDDICNTLTSPRRSHPPRPPRLLPGRMAPRPSSTVHHHPLKKCLSCLNHEMQIAFERE
jgi:hypothetical protein